MSSPLEFEDIEAMRLACGIVDVELRHEVDALGAGDFVRLTLLANPAAFPGQALLVRVTRRRGHAFHGTVVRKPRSCRRAGTAPGRPVAFQARHVHSVAKGASPSGE